MPSCKVQMDVLYALDAATQEFGRRLELVALGDTDDTASPQARLLDLSGRR